MSEREKYTPSMDEIKASFDRVIAAQDRALREQSDMLTRLAQVIAAAAIQREIDQRPCPTCGGDPLRPAFDGRTECHAPWTENNQEGDNR